MKSDKGEMYAARRYITITGERVGEQREIRANQDAINRIYALLKPAQREPPQPEQQAAPVRTHRRSYSLTCDDEGVLDKARRKASSRHKFERLYRGYTTGYTSSSEAHMALIAMLVYWTNGDKEQVDRLFRASDMYKQNEDLQKKWDTVHRSDGTTYGEMTIEKAAKTSRQL